MVVNYKKLDIFNHSYNFTLEVYELLRKFPKDETFGIISQLKRSTSSLCSNICEGSIKTKKEFVRYLNISLGSGKEVEFWLMLSKDLNYLPEEKYKILKKNLDIILGKITNYKKYLSQPPNPTTP
jgi:four helix bundle protein